MPADDPIEPRHIAMLVQGSELYGIATIQKLYARGWPDLLFVCFGDGAMHEWLHEAGARIELIPKQRRYVASNSSKALLSFPAMSRQAKRIASEVHERVSGHGVRVIHTHRLFHQLVAGHMRPLGYKSVWQINNNMSTGRLAGLGKKLNHWLANWGADMLLPASDFIASNWRGCSVPIRTIRNAADPVVEPHPTPQVPPVRCLVAGRIDSSKGHHTAVEAVLQARAAGHDVSLDIYGSPLDENPYADNIRRTIADARADDAIRFKGFCADLRQRHRDYHLGLQCRIDPEPCSLWVCETMVDGLPVLASATGGTPELVDDGVSGYLYPPSNADELAKLLVDLCKNPNRLVEMRAAAQKRGQNHFLDTRLRDETLAAYNSLEM